MINDNTKKKLNTFGVRVFFYKIIYKKINTCGGVRVFLKIIKNTVNIFKIKLKIKI